MPCYAHVSRSLFARTKSFFFAAVATSRVLRGKGISAATATAVRHYDDVTTVGAMCQLHSFRVIFVVSQTMLSLVTTIAQVQCVSGMVRVRVNSSKVYPIILLYSGVLCIRFLFAALAR